MATISKYGWPELNLRKSENEKVGGVKHREIIKHSKLYYIYILSTKNENKQKFWFSRELLLSKNQQKKNTKQKSISFLINYIKNLFLIKMKTINEWLRKIRKNSTKIFHHRHHPRKKSTHQSMEMMSMSMRIIN